MASASGVLTRPAGVSRETVEHTSAFEGEYVVSMSDVPTGRSEMLAWAGVNNRDWLDSRLSMLSLVGPQASPHRRVQVVQALARTRDLIDGCDSTGRDPENRGSAPKEAAHVADVVRLLRALDLRPMHLQEVMATTKILVPIMVRRITPSASESLIFPVLDDRESVRYLALSVSTNLRYLSLLDEDRVRLRVSDRVAALMVP